MIENSLNVDIKVCTFRWTIDVLFCLAKSFDKIQIFSVVWLEYLQAHIDLYWSALKTYTVYEYHIICYSCVLGSLINHLYVELSALWINCKNSDKGFKTISGLLSKRSWDVEEGNKNHRQLHGEWRCIV